MNRYGHEGAPPWYNAGIIVTLESYPSGARYAVHNVGLYGISKLTVERQRDFSAQPIFPYCTHIEGNNLGVGEIFLINTRMYECNGLLCFPRHFLRTQNTYFTVPTQDH